MPGGTQAAYPPMYPAVCVRVGVQVNLPLHTVRN
jgi:hypothetical protein